MATNIWNAMSKLFRNEEKERALKLDLLDMENKFLDLGTKDKTEECEETLNVASTSNASNIEALGTACSSRKGVVTKVNHGDGIIDNTIPFDRHAAGKLFHDLTPGCVVEYLVFKQDNGIFKVVKLQKIVEQCWEEPAVNEVQELLEEMKQDQPTYFKTQQRSILGVITERLPTSIEVETVNGDRTVELDNVEIQFIPKKGDEVTLECTVQLDDGYVDKQGEILQVKKVTPTRTESDQKCTVERVFEEMAVLTKNAYVLIEDVPKGSKLHLGDIVRVDLIDCKHSTFTRRAIKLSLLEKNFGQIRESTVPANGRRGAISVEGVERFVYVGQWQKHTIQLKVKNIGKRTFELKSVEIKNAAESQITVLEPVSSRCIEIGNEIALIFEVQTKFIGEAKETYTLHFDSFKMLRYLTIVVCETEEEAREANRRLIASQELMVSGNTVAQRSREYTYQVFNKKYTLVKGESISTKRRFVASRLTAHEVPEKLREIVLKSKNLNAVRELLASNYPSLMEALSHENYAQRFLTLLFLEEIDYMVSFRNFDRERAHFQRDGDYLSLQVENLAERRPSLVLGDTVNAINPWVEDGMEPKVFQGVIHKVLFNRVQLKFNANFQNQYKNEDYRLEFHFSRFAFRKQQHAVQHIVRHLGENFLFPSKVTKRDHPQLEVQFKDGVMTLFDDKLPWYNDKLNCIQKRAIFNILRGESDNMPYVIFGPPGTGKTVTLVETVLQLVRNLPGARILIGTPSNSSADLITKRIIDSNALKHGEFIRLVSQNQVEKDVVPPELMNYCATVDIGTVDESHESMIVTESGLKLRCQAKFLGKHRVTISTCTTLGNFLQMNFGAGHFTHIVIDEAGQCTEPETMVPVVLVAQKRSQVILAGDPHQLQAIVSSHLAQSFGLSLSFLERLLDTTPYRRDTQRYPNSSGYNPLVLTKLLYNYRALPSIMNVYSKLFYDDELIAQVSEKDSREAQRLAEIQKVFDHNDMPVTQGTFFFGIMGENMQDLDSPSWYNPEEAREVFLFTVLLYRNKVHPDHIGILTPYSKQVKTLRNMFIGADISMPKIGSVEEFQGQERDIMLISTVRSSQANLLSDARLSLGFVRSSKRMNVAISRARYLMVIFGNPNLLSVDDCWRHLILYCANNNAYFGCELPPNIENVDEEKESDGNETDDSDLLH